MSHVSSASLPRAGRAPAGLSDTTLKVLALVLMVMDHIHYFFGFTGLIPEWFSMLGRLSAPLFLFCTVEGFAHTHDRRRYFWRIWAISAGMGLLQFLMMYAKIGVRPDGFFPVNAICMNYAILIPIWQGIDWLRQRRILRGLPAVVLPLAWPFLFIILYSTADGTPAAWLLDSILAALGYTVLPVWLFIIDGGIAYILIGIALYLLRSRRGLQAAAYVALTMLFDFVLVYRQLATMPDFQFSQMFTQYYEWFGVLSVIPMLLYNGTRGRGMKTLFYVFYPAHVYVLYALSWALYLILH